MLFVRGVDGYPEMSLINQAYLRIRSPKQTRVEGPVCFFFFFYIIYLCGDRVLAGGDPATESEAREGGERKE